MTKTEWAYFAGLFDGEGYVSIGIYTRNVDTKSCKAGQTVTNSNLRISNNNLQPLIELREKFGGFLCKPSPSRPDAHNWTINGYAGVAFAKGILPYSRIKADQLRVYIEFSEQMRHRQLGSVKLTKQELTARRRLIAKLDLARKKANGKRSQRPLVHS